MCAKRYVVYGRVQGVGFRYATSRYAQRHGLTGWVRNNVDGTVEVIAEGKNESIQRFTLWLRKGPTGSHVVKLELYDIPATATYRRFTVEF